MLKFGREVTIQLAGAFIVKALMALASVLLLFIVGRRYGAEGLGVFSLLQGIVIILSTLARCGMSGSLIKYVASDKVEGRRFYLRLAIKWSSYLAVGVSLVFWLLRDIIGHFYSFPGLIEMMPGMVLALFPTTMSVVFSGYFKGVREPITASLLENGAINLVAAAILLLKSLFFGDGEVRELAWIYAVSAWAVFLWGLFCLSKDKSLSLLSGGAAKGGQDSKEFIKVSFSFLLIHVAVLANSLLGLVVAGFYLNSAELGQLRVAHQLAALTAFILIVIDVVFPPRYAALFNSGNMDELAQLARQSVYIGLVIALPVFLVILAIPGVLLGFFGEGFQGAETVLLILAAGQIFNVASGSVGFILNMTGYVHIVRNITLLSSLAGLLFVSLLTSLFGVAGAAWGLSLAVVLQNSLLFCFVVRKLGINVWSLRIHG